MHANQLQPSLWCLLYLAGPGRFGPRSFPRLGARRRTALRQTPSQVCRGRQPAVLVDRLVTALLKAVVSCCPAVPNHAGGWQLRLKLSAFIALPVSVPCPISSYVVHPPLPRTSLQTRSGALSASSGPSAPAAAAAEAASRLHQERLVLNPSRGGSSSCAALSWRAGCRPTACSRAAALLHPARCGLANGGAWHSMCACCLCLTCRTCCQHACVHPATSLASQSCCVHLPIHPRSGMSLLQFPKLTARAVGRLFSDCRSGLNLLGPAACEPAPAPAAAPQQAADGWQQADAERQQVEQLLASEGQQQQP